MTTIIDLHGQITSEARVNLKSFLTESRMQRYPKIMISHGYGENKLRTTVLEVLAENDNIKDIYLAHPSQGGAGVTIVEFDWSTDEKY